MHTLFEISLILCMLKLSASQGFCNSAQGKIISGTPMTSLFSNNKRGYNCMIRNNTVKNNSLHSRLFPFRAVRGEETGQIFKVFSD